MCENDINLRAAVPGDIFTDKEKAFSQFKTKIDQICQNLQNKESFDQIHSSWQKRFLVRR